MSNSSLVDFTRLTQNFGNGTGYPSRNAPISKITIHHTAGVCSVEGLGEIFAPAERQASSNYGIGHDGRVGLYVNEEDRAWTSSSAWNDNRAVTIEVSNSAVGEPWPVADHVVKKLIELCVDICQRNGMTELVYTGDKNGSLTLHKWFAPTGCPGTYLSALMPTIAKEVTARLKPVEAGDDETISGWTVQFGFWRNRELALESLKKLKDAGFKGFIARKTVPKRK